MKLLPLILWLMWDPGCDESPTLWSHVDVVVCEGLHELMYSAEGPTTLYFQGEAIDTCKTSLCFHEIWLSEGSYWWHATSCKADAAIFHVKRCFSEDLIS